MKKIFRQYDIRGIVPDELSDSLMSNIARAFATHAIIKGHSKILLAWDNRLSSPRLRDLAIEAILESGCDVLDLGMVVTPVFYFASRHLDIKAGIMITASHNPGEYNGCKLLLGEHTIFGEEIQDIRKRIERQDFFTGPRGRLETLDIIPDYMEMIKDKIKMGPNRPRLVVDCGNGTASELAPRIFRSLGCEVSELYCDSDPTFPHHHPDPVDPKNMADLVGEVAKTGSDLGIGIDGDGDRLGVVDAKGNMIWGDMLMILFWRDILPRYPGSECIVEVKCSQALIDEIKNLGGKPLLYKTGHSLIKSKMAELDAVFTGEMSGHMFFADDYYGFDDALYAGSRLLELLSKSDKNISEMLSDIPRYYSTPEIRVPADDEEKFNIVDNIREHFRPKYPLIEIDGARILFPQGWGLVRASNTGPELIVRCEGNTPEALEQIKEELFGYLQSLHIENANAGGLPFTPVYNYPESGFQDQV